MWQLRMRVELIRGAGRRLRLRLHNRWVDRGSPGVDLLGGADFAGLMRFRK